MIAGLLNHVHKRPGAAIENGQLQVIELDNRVIDAHADERGKQMFGGGNQHALFHQAGGIADAGDVAADRLNLESIKIGAAENDSSAGRRRQDAHGNGRAAVQANTTASNGRADCLLVNQMMVRIF